MCKKDKQIGDRQMELAKLTKRCRDGFPVQTEENTELALKIWDDFISRGYSDNPRKLSDEEMQFIYDNTSFGDRTRSREYKAQIKEYYRQFDDKNSDLRKKRDRAMVLLMKHYDGIRLTQEEIDFYNNCEASVVGIADRIEFYGDGRFVYNDFSRLEKRFGKHLTGSLKLSKEEREALYGQAV